MTTIPAHSNRNLHPEDLANVAFDVEIRGLGARCDAPPYKMHCPGVRRSDITQREQGAHA
ncbi:uncharacterized protein SETTUDRAFT_164363 [Exserohilum turcica Et28A]|uniref:Uncharacterized protein n=1 Tax=Exserohilum turcicum (strain 28A) TaxID=671987 RepID=R0IFP3_EXST2|nr:uncharacterized protein SETTUDRAFT_164363 [Exserohilum turcica Et28A]EOA84065.1 hypothetical protein SETTUDRAFT_164363 [Exserohilum turcica Et28A]